MSVRPIDIGVIQRIDDVGMLKHQQDTKPMIQQQNVQTEMVRRDERMSHQVINPENSNKLDNHADAKEEGKNSYFFSRKKKKQQKEEHSENRILKKEFGNSFDMKV